MVKKKLFSKNFNIFRRKLTKLTLKESGRGTCILYFIQKHYTHRIHKENQSR